MKTYAQYCPIARASEILAERWTPIILRNLLLGCSTFTELAQGAPGLSRALLATRLKELERVGVLKREPNPRGKGSIYLPSEAGQDLHSVMLALGTWGERWLELAPEHVDPGMVLHSWCSWYLAVDELPRRRVVVRFDFPDRPVKANRLWIIFDGDKSEVCRTDPMFEEDAVVVADSKALAEWHLGRIEWAAAIKAHKIKVEGPPWIAKGLPRWNQRSGWARLDVGPRSR